MKQIIEQIKQAIVECKMNGDMFHMPSIGITGVNRCYLNVIEK